MALLVYVLSPQLKCKLFMNKDHILFLPESHHTSYTVLVLSTYLHVDWFITEVIVNLLLLWAALG